MRPAIDSGIVTVDAPVVSYWPIFSLSPETVPEVFAKVNSAFFCGVRSVLDPIGPNPLDTL